MQTMKQSKAALITGVTGQDGSFLAELLLSKGYTVYGTVRRPPAESFSRISHLQDKIRLVQADLIDEHSLIDAVQQTQPDEIYNLAGQSFVPTSAGQPVLTGEFVALGVTRVLEAIRLVNPKIRFYQASTSEMFGKPMEEPQRETTMLHPRSPYGVAKVYGHYMTIHYREQYGIYACSGILFNHESERRGLEFVTRKVTNEVARIKLGLAETLHLGSLDAKRDWGYAKDYVEAMWLMLQQDTPDDYVIATGEVHSVRELVEIAFDRAGLRWQDHVVVDPAFVRPPESTQLVGDPSKAKANLGWTAETQFRQLVEIMVDADLERLSCQRESSLA